MISFRTASRCLSFKWLSFSAVLASASMSQATLAFDQVQMMQQSFLQLTSTTGQPLRYSDPIDLTAYTGQPLVVYYWDDLCDLCLQDIEKLNAFAEENKIKAIAIRLGSKQSQFSLDQPTTSEKRLLKRLHQFTSVDHLYGPYLRKEQLELKKLPALEVFNKAGETAALYPEFNQQWSEIAVLVSHLDSGSFEDYAMKQMPDQPKENKFENPLHFAQIAEPESRDVKLPLYFSLPFLAETGEQRGNINRTYAPESHDLALKRPGVSAEYFLESGSKSSPNYQGINFAYVDPFSLDERIIVLAQTWTASGYEDQTIATDAASPKRNYLQASFETYFNTTRVDAGLFYKDLPYRTDTGLTFDMAHLFWNDRTKINLGLDLYNSSHEESTTVSKASDDPNQRHRLTLSHRLDQQNRITFSWFHDALQGIIENPEDQVEFRFNGSNTIGQQYALYPTTKTQNNYVLQYISAKETYDVAYGYGAYDDSWGMELHSIFARVNTEYKMWQVQSQVTLSHQHGAIFFNDLYDQQNAETLLSRNPDLASFDSLALDMKGAYPLEWKPWNKSAYLTLGASLKYFNFDTLSESSQTTTVDTRQPLTELVIGTSIGLEVKL